MREYGLIGHPLTHSFSQKYFSEKFRNENIRDCSYHLFPLQEISEFPSLLQSHPGLCGLNVTIPHKISVMPFLDHIDETAKAIGAVNTIKITPNSELRTPNLVGYNTDVHGFELSLRPLLQPHHTKALILGTGGASKAVEYVFKKIGIEYLFVTRNLKPGTWNLKFITYPEINKSIITAHPLIINTTPAGMSPDTNSCPDIPYEFLTPLHLLFDLVYNPEETLFLKKGKERGATTQNGLPMLTGQAEKAWEIWNRN